MRTTLSIPQKQNSNPDTYYWRVQVLPNTLASDPLEFSVVTAEERAAIEKKIAAIPQSTDPYDRALTQAHIYVDHRLWFDSLGAYNSLIAKYPNEPELYEDAPPFTPNSP